MIGGDVVERCSKGDGRKAFQDGLCRFHFREQNNPSATPASASAESKPNSSASTPPPTPAQKLTKAEVTGGIVTALGIASTFIDESFSPIDEKTLPDGSKNYTVKPHVDEAITSMMPWMEIYGSSFIKYAPWFGLAGGIFALAAPAIDPCSEIIAGVRKPRFMRKPAPGDPDIYTDEWKAHLAKEKARNPPPGNSGNGKAASAVISVSPSPAGENLEGK